MKPIPLSSLPALNASLNAASTVLLLLGYSFIRRGKVLAHKACMMSAFVCSAVFLGSYIYFHLHAGIIRFGGRGSIRPVYFTLLVSHTILAIVIVPLILITFARALRKRFDRHRAIARWTLPLWLYVSVTGVVIYWLLYRAYTPIGASAASAVCSVGLLHGIHRNVARNRSHPSAGSMV
jgi:putative membrane protein